MTTDAALYTRTAACRAENRKLAGIGRGGRPPMYRSPEAMEEMIEDYFLTCDEHKKVIYDKKADSEKEIAAPRPYTVAGLALHLGFKSRDSLLHYAGKQEFVEVIAKARLRIETQRSEQLIHSSGYAGGIIFDLKNNHGWRDQQEVEMTGPNGGPLQIQAGLVMMPPAPKDMDEWVEWYKKSCAPSSSGEVIDAEMLPAEEEASDGPRREEIS